MVFTPVEIIAAIFIILGAVKMLVLAFNAEAWIKFTEKVWTKPKTIKFVLIVLAGIIFYYLIAELSIVQVLVAIILGALFLSIGLVDNMKDIIRAYSEQIKNKTLLKDNALYIIIWIILLVWGAKTLWF